MKNNFGVSLQITLFGESHGSSVGAVLDGLAPGIAVDEDFIRSQLFKRRPADVLSTTRREADEFIIESGVRNGYTCGTPLCIRIPNCDTRSQDYPESLAPVRPGHADYTAYCKYHGFSDARGGGHFSGRLTAALVAAGAVVIPALNRKGIRLATHILRCAGIDDRKFENLEEDIKALNAMQFAVLDADASKRMRDAIRQAKIDGDSVGGILETVVTGMPAGVGEPWFDTVESVLSHALFSVPAVKAVEFGDGFAVCDLRGSIANDPFCIRDGEICTATNRNGGINGGITNGMPLIFRCGIKPTPTVSVPQQTVDLSTRKPVETAFRGRHDPCIVHRARVVADSMTALVLYDLLAQRYGTDWVAV